MLRTALLFITVFLLGVHGLVAQTQVSTHWFSAQLPVIVNDRWHWVNEASYRTIGESFSLNQLFLRTGIRYNFKNDRGHIGFNGDLIYSRLSPDKSEDHFGKEKRLWQEVNYQLPIRNDFIVVNRIRIDERFFEAVPNKKAFTAIRFRYRLGLQKQATEKWTIQVANEFMSQLQNKLTFNQNRVIASATYRLGVNTHLQTAYIWNKLPVGSQHSASFIFQKRIVLHAKGSKS